MPLSLGGGISFSYICGRTKNESMKVKEKLEEKLKNDPGVKALKAIIEEEKLCDSFKLTGGAVIDILEGRRPKDYDVYTTYNSYSEISRKLGHRADVKLLYTSETSITLLIKSEFVLQLLKGTIGSFNFEIEMSEFSLGSGKLSNFDYLGYREKRLVINERCTKKIPKYRIKHWKKKGYTINPITLKSHNHKIDKESKSVFKWIKKAVRKTIKNS